ncbi:hypothetical protein, partial [Phenylobacterium sp.]|uniref:hypothetical protein n=1 Tax=Phenylobacterium sp. TaxID=1871053 RepID=UPI00286A8E00
MAKPFKLNDDRLLSVEPETRAIARAVCRGCAACRSSARMGTPIWSGSRRTRRYRTPPRCCWRPTLAGCYPILKLGPASWFHDSPEGMRRFR